jgi:hypothetical protein
MYAPKSKSINTILRSRIILFLFLIIFLVVLVVFITLSRKASGLTREYYFLKWGHESCTGLIPH